MKVHLREPVTFRKFGIEKHMTVHMHVAGPIMGLHMTSIELDVHDLDQLAELKDEDVWQIINNWRSRFLRSL